MAYAVPKQWAHGETVSHTNMQKYSDGLNAIHAKTGDAAYNYAILWPYDNYDVVYDNSFYVFVHKKRYLWFRSTGELVDPVRHADPAGLAGEDDIGLSETGTDYGIYDLESIDWLVYGALYYVTGVTVAMEID